MSRIFLVSLLGALVSSCGSAVETPDVDFSDKRSNAKVQTSTPELSDKDLIRVCTAGSAFRVSRSVQGIQAKLTEGRIVRLAYTRDIDGKRFRYDCKASGNVLKFRMIDERGPNTGPGIWSGAGSTTTFKLNPDSVYLHDQFTDGSSDEDTIAI